MIYNTYIIKRKDNALESKNVIFLKLLISLLDKCIILKFCFSKKQSFLYIFTES
jgi:hypothetical protein